MARTAKEIKTSLEIEFMKSALFSGLYGFDQGDDFNTTFSTISFESILLYILSFLASTIELLQDAHASDVTAIIAEQKPHTKNWYKNKALAYMHGYNLVDDTDVYDVSLLTAAQISTAKVVKYAAVVEQSNIVYIKVAGAGLQPLTDDHEAGLVAYFKEIKDAGVKLEIVNLPADYFKASLVIYYDPMILNSTGINAITATESVRDAVNAFIASLPFNGEYRNTALIDALQAVPGVVMPELQGSQISVDGSIYTDIDAYVVPKSGYMKLNDDTDLTIIYKVYETVGE
jgi:hypothetical protein